MDVQALISQALPILAVVGGVAIALPALLGAVAAFFMVIPGEQPEKFINEKLLPLAQKLADLVGKFSRK